MKLINQRELIRGVAKAWREAYSDARYGADKATIGRKLAKLNGETATAAEVEAIIGNPTWTNVPTCDECGKENPPAVVEIGRPPDYESSTAHVCQACIAKAIRLFARGRNVQSASPPEGGK